MASINSGRDFVASDTTTSTTSEGITGLSTTVDVDTSASIVAFMSVESSVDTNNAEGYWTITIDGVDSPVITRKHSKSGDTGSVAVLFRSASKTTGTYTVTGNHYTESGVTLTSAQVTLVAFALEDTSGNDFANVYDTVASDTSTSNSLEDIDGLTQTPTLAGTSHIFGAIAATVSNSQANRDVGVAVNLAGEVFLNNRSVGTGGDKGSIGVVGRSPTKQSGSPVIKGQHKTENGTITTAPSIMFGMELGSAENLEIPSGLGQSETANTTSSSLADITGTDHTITTAETSHIFAIMSLDATNTVAADCDFAISINGTDYDAVTRTMSAGGDASILVVARTTATLSPGTYTVVGRWSTPSGTLSLSASCVLVSIGLENSDPGVAAPRPASTSRSTIASARPSSTTRPSSTNRSNV